MYDHRLSAFDQPVTIIHPGEYLATEDDIIISTVLGSCVAVALRDERAGIGGLNHFMLPGVFKHSKEASAAAKDFIGEGAKYGMYAMELLINDLLKLGCRKERLAAKVFGGAMLLGMGNDGRVTVAEGNIAFALKYLETERIPVLSSDVGGGQARKILFFVKSGKVLLKRTGGTMAKVLVQEEHSYLDRIRSRAGVDQVVFFGALGSDDPGVAAGSPGRRVLSSRRSPPPVPES